MKTITVYSTPTCHFCHMAKEFFDANHVAYTDIDVSNDAEKKKEILDMTGQLGVPVIKIEEEGKDPVVMVGFNENLIIDALGPKA
jgi:glutaredoxin